MKQVRHRRLADRPDLRWNVLSTEQTGYIARRASPYGPGEVTRFLSKDDYALVPEPMRMPCALERWLAILAFTFCGIAAGGLIYLWVWAE